MDQAIRINNRIFERKQEQQYNLDHSDETPPNQPVSRTYPQQYQQQQYVYNSNHQQIQQPSAPTTATPVNTSTTDDMDIDFARRGPLTTTERQQRFSQGLCLVCGQSGHLKATCPRSNSRFRPQRQVQAIAMEGHNFEVSGNDLGRL
ncbi:hypothetical protein BASA83_012961 [Batrachochytrium salamandrivorans]|nr:hypothetical protein BASA83_012961 [Batrachochytrium salamandrivorans]